MAKALSIVAASVIAALLFPATVHVLDRFDPAPIANQKRASDVKILRDAIDRYYKDHGSYPVLPGKPVDDLSKDLVPAISRKSRATRCAPPMCSNISTLPMDARCTRFGCARPLTIPGPTGRRGLRGRRPRQGLERLEPPARMLVLV
jgi:hypothetical protein